MRESDNWSQTCLRWTGYRFPPLKPPVNTPWLCAAPQSKLHPCATPLTIQAKGHFGIATHHFNGPRRFKGQINLAIVDPGYSLDRLGNVVMQIIGQRAPHRRQSHRHRTQTRCINGHVVNQAQINQV